MLLRHDSHRQARLSRCCRGSGARIMDDSDGDASCASPSSRRGRPTPSHWTQWPRSADHHRTSGHQHAGHPAQGDRTPRSGRDGGHQTPDRPTQCGGRAVGGGASGERVPQRRDVSYSWRSVVEFLYQSPTWLRQLSARRSVAPSTPFRRASTGKLRIVVANICLGGQNGTGTRKDRRGNGSR